MICSLMRLRSPERIAEPKRVLGAVPGNPTLGRLGVRSDVGRITRGRSIQMRIQPQFRDASLAKPTLTDRIVTQGEFNPWLVTDGTQRGCSAGGGSRPHRLDAWLCSRRRFRFRAVVTAALST